jgi:NAD(P)-dependent dehydrogenase (short-subunit alcohol dehydrogenase family)
METIKGKWALVTGASRGIGRTVALGPAQKSCNIVIHARGYVHINWPTKCVSLSASTQGARQDEGQAKNHRKEGTYPAQSGSRDDRSAGM